MDELVLISKKNGAAGLDALRSGRPIRTKFCLRRYGPSYILSLPFSLCADGDKIDFFLSASGFAVKIGPDGERSISGKRTGRTATIPKELSKRLESAADGVTDLIYDERPDRLYFFPFSQFAAA